MTTQERILGNHFILVSRPYYTSQIYKTSQF